LMRALGYARAQLEMLDDAFAVIRPAVLACMPVLEGLREAIKIPIDSSDSACWWFQDGEALLQAEDDAFKKRYFPKTVKHPEAVPVNLVQFLRRSGVEREEYLAAADGGETLEIPLNRGEDRFHLAVSLGESGAHFLLRDEHGAPPAWAESVRLVIEFDEGVTKVHPFDDNGLILLSHKEFTGVTRIQLKDNGGENIWQEG